MKRIISLAAVAIMVFVLVGCGGGSDSKYVGEWKLTKANYAGIEMTAEEIGMDATLDVKGNGKLTLEFDGEKAEGEWEEKDGNLVIKGDDTGDVTAEMVDGNIVLNYSGVGMVFEKK